MILVCFLAVIACSAAFAGAEAGNYRQGPAGARAAAERRCQAKGTSSNSTGPGTGTRR